MFDDGGEDSVVEGASVELGRNRKGTVPFLYQIPCVRFHIESRLFVSPLYGLWSVFWTGVPSTPCRPNMKQPQTWLCTSTNRCFPVSYTHLTLPTE